MPRAVGGGAFIHQHHHGLCCATSFIVNTLIKERRIFLLSEIEINRVNENEEIILDKILKSIQAEGFEKTAKKFSVSSSSEYGGNIGWINQKNLSKKIYENIKLLKTEEISKPIFLNETIVIIKKGGERKYGKNIRKMEIKRKYKIY